MTERVKRGPGRPPKNRTRATSRPNRVPVSGYRDILGVAGKDPDYYYRLVKDKSEGGTRVLRFLQGGYEFVTSDENLVIGEEYVYKTENVGSVYRIPANDEGGYYYLMKIHRDFYEEDQMAKEDHLRRQEEDLHRADPGKGQYGKVSNEAKNTPW